MDHSSHFDEARLLEEACEAAALTDFGNDDFRGPLSALLAALGGEAPLNEAGAAIMRGRILESLVSRLRAEDWLRRYPEIEEESIEAPLVVVGMTRTGTTMLQRVLASDPRHYAALWWETRNPTPWPGTKWDERDPRIADAEAEVREILETAPEQAAIHPWDPLAPDEEIMILEHAFLSHVPECYVSIPAYRRWLDAQDFTPSYRYLHKVLQFLQWQKKQRGEYRGRWVLKTPGHLGFLPTLFEVFPDAHVIQTHRNPVETIPSSVSLNFSLWNMTTDAPDPVEAGRQWMQRMQWALARCMAFRDSIPDEAQRFTDIWFRDALSDPLAQVERIYAAVGEELVPEARAAMQAWLVENARDKRPAHDYSADAYGFDEAELRAGFADYIERFIAPFESR